MVWPDETFILDQRIIWIEKELRKEVEALLIYIFW